MNSVFITGTGTDVGKTFISALLVKKLKESGVNIGYYKAAMSGNKRDLNGNLIPGDAQYVKSISKINQSLDSMCPYVYEQALSPHLAAKLEGNPVDLEEVKKHFDKLKKQYDCLIVEGSGGIVCPIRYDENKIFLEDIIKTLNLPCIIVADTKLGMINQTVLTVEYMKSKGIEIEGIIYNRFNPNDIMQIDNIKMCEEITGIRTLAKVGDNSYEIIL